MDNIFFDIGIIIFIATIGAFIARLLRQPKIPTYILTGVIIGPVLGLITDMEMITTLSEIGVAFLLFMVGLEVDLKKLKNVALVATVGGVITVVTSFILGFLIAFAIAFSYLEAVYVGLMVGFGSTMVVVKILADKRELDTLHGRIIIGTLLTEDVIAVVALIALSTVNKFSPLLLLTTFIKGSLIALLAFLCSKFLFPVIFKFAAKSRELLFLASIAVCFVFSFLFANIGFSIAIGAFVGGITLANLPYNFEIIGRIKSLRDFFATIFFVSLGMELFFGDIGNLIFALIVITLFVLLVKPFIRMLVCVLFGYKSRPSFLTAMSLAQVSEFALIIVAQGLALGHISQGLFSLTIIIAMITITFTSYFIQFDNYVYQKMAKFLELFENLAGSTKELEYMPEKSKHSVVLCGYNRIGYSVFKTLRRLKKKLLVVDYNPEVIRKLIDMHVPCFYGDIGDIEVLDRLGLRDVKMVVSTIPDKADNLLLIKKTKDCNKKSTIYVTANTVEDALNLYDAGADYVILPHFLGGEHFSLLIEDFTGDIAKVLELKMKHIHELKHRRSIGHKHPDHHH